MSQERTPFVAVEDDPRAPPPDVRTTVQLTLTWGKDVVAIAHAPPTPKPVLRASDIEGPIAAAFGRTPLARARSDGGWDLLLPEGRVAPPGTQLSLRLGRTTLRVQSVVDDVDREPLVAALPPESRARRVLFGATILHVAIVLAGVWSAPARAPAPEAVTVTGPPLHIVFGGGSEEGALALPELELEAAVVEAPSVEAPSVEARVVAREVTEPAERAEPGTFGMISVVRSRGALAGPRRAALTFETFEPPPQLLAMFTPRIDEGVSAAGLTMW